MKLTDRLSLCWRILRAEPDNCMEHADRELPPADGDEMQALMNQNIKEMVLVFGTHGHSGFSASYAIASLEKILRFQPLRPLTGGARRMGRNLRRQMQAEQPGWQRFHWRPAALQRAGL